MIDIPENKSVLLITSYRCGSTAFCDFISKKNNCVNYNEVFNSKYPRRPANNLETFKNNYANQKFVVKVMPNQVISNDNRYILNQLFEICYSIKLRRKNIFEQILSYYLGYTTKKWNYDIQEEKKEYFVDVNKNSLNNCVNYIRNVNSMLDNYVCNIDVFYEDLIPIKSDIRKYDQPINIEEIKKALKNHEYFTTKYF